MKQVDIFFLFFFLTSFDQTLIGIQNHLYPDRYDANEFEIILGKVEIQISTTFWIQKKNVVRMLLHSLTYYYLCILLESFCSIYLK